MSRFIAGPEHGCAWITGASSGIGHALALRLAGRGWTVAATARSRRALEDLAEQSGPLDGTVRAFPGDTTDRAAMAEIVTQIAQDAGPIALAVLNAGVYRPVSGASLDLDDVLQSLEVNLGGTVHCLVPVIEQMKQAGRGQIALTSSVAGYGGLPTSAAYGATKAGLINMAESLKFDLDRLNIRIQIINPGFVDTPATAKNPFPMPLLMPVGEAADQLARGLRSTRFEISFPKLFTRGLKALNLLPYPIYFWAVNRFTGWDRKQV